MNMAGYKHIMEDLIGSSWWGTNIMQLFSGGVQTYCGETNRELMERYEHVGLSNILQGTNVCQTNIWWGKNIIHGHSA